MPWRGKTPGIANAPAVMALRDIRRFMIGRFGVIVFCLLVMIQFLGVRKLAEYGLTII
jgi:hypothetical protein